MPKEKQKREEICAFGCRELPLCDSCVKPGHIHKPQEPSQEWEERLGTILKNYMPNEGIRNLVLNEYRQQIQAAESRGYEKAKDEARMICPLVYPKVSDGSLEGLVLYKIQDARQEARQQALDEILEILPKEKHFRTMYSQESRGFLREDYAAGYNDALASAIEEIKKLK